MRRLKLSAAERLSCNYRMTSNPDRDTKPGPSLVSEPARYGLDLVMPVFFTVMLAPLWRGVRAALPWAVDGGVIVAAVARNVGI